MMMTFRQSGLMCLCAGLGGAGITLAVVLPATRIAAPSNVRVFPKAAKLPEITLSSRSLNRKGARRIRTVIPRISESYPARKKTRMEGALLPIPYRVTDAHCGRRLFLNAVVPEKTVLVNLLTGQKQILDFDTTRHGVGAYVPADVRGNSTVALFVMSDATFRLIESDGTRCDFDAAGYLTDMRMTPNSHIHFEYASGLVSAFVATPYAVNFHGSDRVRFLNATIPKEIEVADLIHGRTEVLVFSKDERIAGYVPANGENSRYRMLALMSDTSLRLVDKVGNNVVFNSLWAFKGIIPPAGDRVIKSMSSKSRSITLRYTIDSSGSLMIAAPPHIHTPRERPTRPRGLLCRNGSRQWPSDCGDSLEHGTAQSAKWQNMLAMVTGRIAQLHP